MNRWNQRKKKIYQEKFQNVFLYVKNWQNLNHLAYELLTMQVWTLNHLQKSAGTCHFKKKTPVSGLAIKISAIHVQCTKNTENGGMKI